MRRLELALLSEYRTQLMGISAIMILICHAPAYVPFSSLISKCLCQFQIGVDFFFLLSGLGLYYSLNKYSKNHKFKDVWNFSKGGWILGRFVKLFVPYLLISLIFIVLRCFLGLQQDGVIDTVLSLSTIGFWINHKGVWFVCALVPLYCLAPLLYSLFQRRNNDDLFLVVLIALCYIPRLLMIINDNPSAGLLYNIDFVSVRAPSFILGMWIAWHIKNNINLSPLFFVFIFFLGLVITILTRHPFYGYPFFTAPILYLICIIMRAFNSSFIERPLKFMGRISLESYLMNGLLTPIVFKVLRIDDLDMISGLGIYLVATIIGIWFAHLFHISSQKVIKRSLSIG